jgi:hypothetical protein
MKRNLILILALTLFELFTVGKTDGQGNRTKSWDVTFQAYTGKGEQDMPIQVLTVDILVHSHVLWVREWRLRNRSDKTVVKIRPTLFVYKEQDPDSLLFRREAVRLYGVRISSGIEWPTGQCLPQAKSCQNAFATLSLEELMESLVRDGKLDGKYRVAFGIDKVWFEDGTIWEFENAPK